jgi:hypothetical protein
MLAICLLILAQSNAIPLRAMVVDVSKDDAIYEDVSRELSEALAQALTLKGLASIRVDERELPLGCRLGPCLKDVAQHKSVQIVITVDAQELSATVSLVAAAALDAKNGAPLAGTRYRSPSKDQKKAIDSFAKAIVKSMAQTQRTPSP